MKLPTSHLEFPSLQCYDLDFKKEGGGGADMKKSVPQLIEYYKSWLSKYPFVSIEVHFFFGCWWVGWSGKLNDCKDPLRWWKV